MSTQVLHLTSLDFCKKVLEKWRTMLHACTHAGVLHFPQLKKKGIHRNSEKGKQKSKPPCGTDVAESDLSHT